MGLATGNVLDRYVIEGLLGTGAMGRVYRATDTRLRRAVALKVLDAATATGAETEAALREARAAAAIVHPNVTAVFDADNADGTAFIVMELVPGTPLRQLIGDHSVPVGTRVRWLIEIGAALAAAHQVGIVHRDIKPENVIVRPDGMVKVLDFGIARFAAGSTPALGIHGISVTSSGQTGLAGTPAYMAPEQIQGSAVDGRVDQFAWGALGYELLTGALPWKDTAGPFGLLAAILNDEPPPLPDAVPAEVAAVVLRALQKPRDARFASIVEAATALIPWSTGPLPLIGLAPDSRTRARAPRAPRPAEPVVEPPPNSTPRIAPLAYSVNPPSLITEDAGTPGDTEPPPSLRTLAAALDRSRSIAAPPPSTPPPEDPRPVPARSSYRSIAGTPAPARANRPPPPLCDPDFVGPVDVEAHVALLPSGATCKGLFFSDLVRLGARSRTTSDLHQQAGIPERRYFAFRDYPAADYLRLTVTVARLAYPGLPLGQALRRLGQGAFDSVMGSHLGKTIFGVLDRDLDQLLAHWPKTYELFYSFGLVTLDRQRDGVYALRIEHFPMFLETYQIGMIEAALRRCHAAGRVRLRLASLAEATIEIDAS